MEKIVIFRDLRISRGVYVVHSPYGALELDDKGKPVLVRDLCRDDLARVLVCPVAAVRRSSEASRLPVEKWYKVRRSVVRVEAEEWCVRLTAARGN
jgi:ferredoxin